MPRMYCITTILRNTSRGHRVLLKTANEVGHQAAKTVQSTKLVPRDQITLQFQKELTRKWALTNKDYAAWESFHPKIALDHFAIWGFKGPIGRIQQVLHSLGYYDFDFKLFSKDAQKAYSWAHRDLPTDAVLFSVNEWDPTLSPASADLVKLTQKYADRTVLPEQEELTKLNEKLAKEGALPEDEVARYVELSTKLFTNNTPKIRVEEFDQAHHEGCPSVAWTLTNGQTPNHLALRVSDLAHALRHEITPNYPNARGDQKFADKTPGLSHSPLGAQSFVYPFSNGAAHRRLVKGTFLGFAQRDLTQPLNA